MGGALRRCKGKMTIIEDTRQQSSKHEHTNAQIKSLGHNILRSKLPYGDYARLDRMTVAIDTKKDYVELAGNICGPQHLRFRTEIVGAQENGIQLIILIEEPEPAVNWTSPVKKSGEPYSKVSGITLQRAMNTMSEKYGVIFIPCDKSDTGMIIVDILQNIEKWEIKK